MQQQQQMGQQQQNVMPQPPNIITTKDHLYITDMLAWNLLAMKKAHHFASQCQDQQIAQALEEAGKMHYNHYQTLMTHLDQQQQQAQMQQNTMQ
ncbi:hypothetical protein [Evansella cellulosilytica]|uniref:Uncharacterized protein n=1 Tax=Evansella cellulosilytica (strain ATCC 21833 / DSM 2522 / FERM P-1141 / JCM 9156 / N-4) TaxID=649639 RepID=E6TQR8_EVAC2|nr:hypothetical protein [Evansella cellulosilytica]ADU31693.1 hypothetical protein Bcell_3451 [Evansella cellulosilytica DSM 2522]